MVAPRAKQMQIDLRLSPQAKQLLEDAACISGQSLHEFAVSTLLEQARRIVHANGITVLSNRDRDIFLAMLDADARPNEALRRAANRYKKKYG
jgi:uncharacterized protein (DUF1778 family)